MPRKPRSAVRDAESALGLLRGRWKLLILRQLSHGPQRTGQLVRALDGVAKNRLNQNLRGLAKAGLLRRTIYPGRVPRVEYGLTPLGASLCPIIDTLFEWGARHSRSRRG